MTRPNETLDDTLKEYIMAIDKKSFIKTRYPNIKIHKAGVKFWFDFTINKKRYSRFWESNPRHTKADKLRQAQNQLQIFRDEVMHQGTIEANMNATVYDYWLKLKAVKDWKPYMVKEYDHYYKKNLTKLSNIKIKDLKPAHFTTLNTTLVHLSTRSRVKAYEILNPLIALAIEDEIIFKSPIKKSHVAKRKSLEEKKVISAAADKYRTIHAAIHRIYGTTDLIVIDENTKIQCRISPVYRAAFLFCFFGRRVGEALQLHWEDIDFANDLYTVRGHTSKVNTDMTFTLIEDIKDALLEFQDVTGEIFPFKSIDRQYYKIREATGINEFTAHWLRNLSVSALASTGTSTTHLSAMLGHTDGGTIRKYLSLQREASTAITNEASKKLLS